MDKKKKKSLIISEGGSSSSASAAEKDPLVFNKSIDDLELISLQNKKMKKKGLDGTKTVCDEIQGEISLSKLIEAASAKSFNRERSIKRSNSDNSNKKIKKLKMNPKLLQKMQSAQDKNYNKFLHLAQKIESKEKSKTVPKVSKGTKSQLASKDHKNLKAQLKELYPDEGHQALDHRQAKSEVNIPDPDPVNFGDEDEDEDDVQELLSHVDIEDEIPNVPVQRGTAQFELVQEEENESSSKSKSQSK